MTILDTHAYAPTSTWLPRELMARARQQPKDLFIRAYKSPLSLVVVLEDPLSELALGLRGAHGRSPEQAGLPFRTAAANVDGDGRRPPRPDEKELSERERLLQRLVELSHQCCYVAPIRKRGEAAFLDAISVGRSRNHDIVLRHASVSKFHANLELEGDQLFVKDAGSRNHTFVNHERAEGRTRVRAGDVLRFGWVEALLSTDEALWDLARGT